MSVASGSSYSYGGRGGGFNRARRFGKAKFVRHPLYRNIRLKTQFDVNSRVVSADYFLQMTAATDGSAAILMISGDGAWSSSGQAIAQPLVLGYYSNDRFNSVSSGFKEYTIVGVKATFTPHRVVTAAVNSVQRAYQSSYVSDHTIISVLNINGITDQVVLGKSKPKSYLPEEKLVRYMKFGYYTDTQFSKKYIKTTGGTAAGITRQTWIEDEQEDVPAIVIRAESPGVNGLNIGEVHVRVYYRFQGKNLAN